MSRTEPRAPFYGESVLCYVNAMDGMTYAQQGDFLECGHFGRWSISDIDLCSIVLKIDGGALLCHRSRCIVSISSAILADNEIAAYMSWLFG